MAAIDLRYENGTVRIDDESDSSNSSDEPDEPDEPDDALSTHAVLESHLDAELIRELDLKADPRSDTSRTPAFRYAELRAALSASPLAVDDRVLSLADLPPLESAYELRPYQAAALGDWLETDRWADLSRSQSPELETARAPAGVLELPTGSGKTVIAIEAIETLQTPTLVVVPTIDLQEQWIRELEREFAVDVGRFGGGEQRLGPITVSTYDSAYLKADAVGDRFGLVVFDEVHHLGGEGYREIARLLAAPARLGLTATFERPDDAHEVIEGIVGPLVHRVDVDELAGDHLAAYDLKRLAVSLTDAEREAYDRHQKVFTDYLARSNIQFRSGSDYQELVKRSGSDPEAREALLAKQRARAIVYGSDAKLEALEGILDDHRDDRIIVFTAFNDLVYDVSERFLIPAITHQTGTAERREILERFRDGTYSRVVTSNVLDEGVDVPDATVAVVLSGSGSEREFTQRLGRILRPKADGRRAILYEVVANDTAEENVSQRRR
ncbi:DEAD/DEAH box helicase [Natronoglomus mannanivorans]|uniref:DNA 3'-5' helicase n=1 Tax=Natronoglomus mannanivorans TaxID=2979990 RepID=A0AAP2YZ20_9EURY|nr:DEAD/DEAH box helicase family protein [Halobacteria archaeon AArc-xg1-1]